MDYDYETIEAKMKSLPDELQEAMTSFDTVSKVEEIGKKYNLHIDQIGALGDVTSYVMLGLVPSKNFVSTLAKKAEIDEKTALEIGKEVNTEIFDGIRESLRKIEEKESTDNTDLAQAGGITVEKSRASEDVVSANRPTMNANPQLSAAITLDAIENPPAFVNRLLTGTSTSINETVVKTAMDIPVKPSSPQTIVPPKPPTPSAPKVDPYREPIQ